MQIPFLNRWHPVLALRYLPVLKHISNNQTVLEVGSGSLGIGPYLKREFTGVDLDFSDPSWPQMEKVKASATKLPQENNSFDVVISLDMLEHLPEDQRRKAIIEMFRVAREKVIIGVPIGELAHKQDIDLDALYQKTHGKRHRFLKEQTEHGLPSKEEMTSYINQAAKKLNKRINTSLIPNLNLKLRFLLLKGWINQNPLVNVFFRKILLFFIPILRLFNQPPVYRQIFIVEMK